MPGLRSRFMRQMRFGVLVLIGCLLSTGISFTMVRVLLRDYSMVNLPPTETVRLAQTLRRTSNQFVAVCSEYNERLPPESGAPLPDDEAWIRQQFLPVLRELQRELAGINAGSTSALTIFRDTIDRAIGMATYPGDGVLRARVLAAAKDAVGRVEAWIAESTVAPARLESPVKVDF